MHMIHRFWKQDAETDTCFFICVTLKVAAVWTWTFFVADVYVHLYQWRAVWEMMESFQPYP